MKPSALLKYWSKRPLDKNQFFDMISRDYKVVNNNTTHLKDFLYQSQGQIPAVLEHYVDPISNYNNTNYGQMEYLVYYSHDTQWPYSPSDIDTSFNPLAPLDSNAPNFITSDMTRQQRDVLCSGEGGWKCVGISNYGEDGIEIEFERFVIRIWEHNGVGATGESSEYSLRAFLQNDVVYDNEWQNFRYEKTQEYIQLEYRKSSIQSLNYPPTGDVV
tara:strand:- start:6256 stop:6903 length:648 start_codon:yes stop_codon:yes gene_type:complete